MQTSNKQFVNGIKAFKPSEKAPGFVKANLSFNKSELQGWLNNMPENFKANLKESSKDSYYLEVDTYQPNNAVTKTETPQAGYNNNPADDLPF